VISDSSAAHLRGNLVLGCVESVLHLLDKQVQVVELFLRLITSTVINIT